MTIRFCCKYFPLNCLHKHGSLHIVFSYGIFSEAEFFNVQTYPKRIKQVEETPGNNNIVIKSNKEGNDCTSDSDASNWGMDHIPCPQWALSKSLTNAELNKEKWHPFQYYHDQEWNKKSPCKKSHQNLESYIIFIIMKSKRAFFAANKSYTPYNPL